MLVPFCYVESKALGSQGTAELNERLRPYAMQLLDLSLAQLR